MIWNETWVRQHIDEISKYSKYVELFSKDFIRQFKDKIRWYKTHTYLGDIKEKDYQFWDEIIDDVTKYMERDFKRYCDPYIYRTFQDFRKHFGDKCFRD